MTTRLAARNIQVRYAPDTSLVVSQFSEELKSGVFVGMIGPNGSGKSTAIRALSRTLRPSGGIVLLDERDLYAHHSARSSAQAIGVKPQDTSVSLDFSVRDVVRMGRAPHLPQRPFASETPEDEKIVDDALLAAQVADLAERAVTTLSGGERQRVLFARALAQQAEILLLDEPTASLDLRHQIEILTLARDLAHRGGKAVLAVLHDVNLAATYCDRLVLLHGGKVAASGTPAEVLTAENFQTVYRSAGLGSTAPGHGAAPGTFTAGTSAAKRIGRGCGSCSCDLRRRNRGGSPAGFAQPRFLGECRRAAFRRP